MKGTAVLIFKQDVAVTLYVVMLCPCFAEWWTQAHPAAQEQVVLSIADTAWELDVCGCHQSHLQACGVRGKPQGLRVHTTQPACESQSWASALNPYKSVTQPTNTHGVTTCSCGSFASLIVQHEKKKRKATDADEGMSGKHEL